MPARRWAMLLACALVLTGCGAAKQPTAPAATPTARVAVGLLHLHDDARGRDLPTQLRYPTRGNRLPLVVFAHGLGADPGAYDELLTAWAEAGFVVAAPAFPLTVRGSAGTVEDVVNQPADVSFVIDQLLAADDGNPVAGRIDPAAIAVAGHSAGAVTVLGLLSRCCADPRITAAVVLAGTTRGFGTDPVRPGVPTLFVHGGADTVIPAAEGRAAFDAAPGPAAWLELPGAGHSAPFDDDRDPMFFTVRAATTAFLTWALTHDARALADLRRGPPGLTEDRLTPAG